MVYSKKGTLCLGCLRNICKFCFCSFYSLFGLFLFLGVLAWLSAIDTWCDLTEILLFVGWSLVRPLIHPIWSSVYIPNG